MKRKPSRGLFITGTDTEVGKTYVASLLAQSLLASGLRVGVYKPTASGCRREGGRLISRDAVQLWEAAGRPDSLEAVCPQPFEAPLAPHLAARAEAKHIDPQLLSSGIGHWKAGSDIVLVEGAGGLMSPLADQLYNADLAGELGYPLLVVTPNVLGVINQTLQTLIAAATYRDGLHVAGIVLNDVDPERSDQSADSNREELSARCVPPVLAHIRWGAKMLDEPVDWFALAGSVTS